MYTYVSICGSFPCESDTRARMWRTFACFQAGMHLTFGERVGLNHVQKRVDHVEKNTDGTRFIIRVRFVHHRRHEAKIQWRSEHRGARRRVIVLFPGFAARETPAHHQHEPYFPPHVHQSFSRHDFD